ncbi:MAG: dephospho-CoA kinase [Kiritimatiellae bacterium]|nr:dephospho-CoA kinase [Kiritimatiellia bacterium]
MLRIAVTGGIACGKSLAGTCLEKMGVAVRDADDLAHELMEPGAPAYGPVVAEFGKGILNGDGRIDRRRLGRLVFGNPARREALNRIVHPKVREQWERWLDEQPGSCAAAAVIIPLLFETGAERDWDAVICVTADAAAQEQRLRNRGLSPEEIRGRLNAQMPLGRKAEKADYVLTNNGTPEWLEEQVRNVLKHILEK